MFDIKHYKKRIENLPVGKKAAKVMNEELEKDLSCMNRLIESGYMQGEIKKLFEMLVENMICTLEGKNNKKLN